MEFCSIGVWQNASSMTIVRELHSACTLNGTIYAVGGGGDLNGTTHASAERYDSRRDAWESIANMPYGVTRHAAACVDDVVYILGGRKDVDSPILKSTLRFIPTLSLWAAAPAM